MDSGDLRFRRADGSLAEPSISMDPIAIDDPEHIDFDAFLENRDADGFNLDASQASNGNFNGLSPDGKLDLGLKQTDQPTESSSAGTDMSFASEIDVSDDLENFDFDAFLENGDADDFNNIDTSLASNGNFDGLEASTSNLNHQVSGTLYSDKNPDTKHPGLQVDPASGLASIAPAAPTNRNVGISSYWSIQESQHFEALVQRYGRDWEAIAKKMPAKIENTVNL